ncbi:MAG TPA: carboxypeptidase-like regulatory domain-containing protein [Gemmatimonadaceae bacterium]|nr:carboxypeptidase-like regulatory domain-containing protein [Gemmatimonadaceae bacterium]
MRRLLAVGGVSIVFASAALAQGSVPARHVLVFGRVAVAGDTARPVSGASVGIDSMLVRTTTDPDGRFALTLPGPGRYDLRVRRIGYSQIVRSIDVADSLRVSLELAPQPPSLPAVMIAGKMVTYPARFAEVYRRASHENVVFLTREEIERRQPADMRSLLEGIPTVMVNDRGVTFRKCQKDLNGLKASAIQGAFATTEPARAETITGKVQVYIDGTRVTASADADRAFGIDAVGEALRMVNWKDVQAIEIYSGVSRIPAEFLNDACAVIAIWTKSY